MPTYSASVNGQLVSVFPASILAPAGAPAPLVSAGSAPSTLPANIQGGAVTTGAGAGAGQAGGSAAPGGGGATGTLAGLGSNVWSLPPWHNPLFLVLFFLILAYLGLKFIHWEH
jgi:hypothetical protein